MAFQRGVTNMATSTETMVEDTFISEMLAEFGKFNADFFVMKIMSKSIDTIGTDPQKFIMLTDLAEDCLLQCGRLNQTYEDEKKTILQKFEENEGKEPQSPDKKLEWKLGFAVKRFALIFGKQSKGQPVEISGLIDPPAYLKIKEEKRQAKHDDYMADKEASINDSIEIETEKALNSDEV